MLSGWNNNRCGILRKNPGITEHVGLFGLLAITVTGFTPAGVTQLR